MRVEINVLGSLTASINNVSFVPTASKPRQVLALLSLNPGKLVTVAAIMEEIWGEMLPRSVTATLHTYIFHLRRNLDQVLAQQECSPKDLLRTEHTGYLLNVEPADVDASRYHELSEAGRRAADDGDYATAAQTLRAALSVWRGPALADVPTGSQMQIEVLRLEESRLSDLELRIDADLRLQRHRRVLGELAVLCAQHPMLESFHAQYMLALYRSGRQWRALEVYRRLRNAMVGDLGVDPSHRLRHLHQSVLAADPALDDPGYASSAWVPAAFAG